MYNVHVLRIDQGIKRRVEQCTFLIHIILN